MFARHCDNDDLIKRLRSALTDRNYVAHKAINHYMEHRGNDTAKFFWEIKKIEDEGYALLELLDKERKKLTYT